MGSASLSIPHRKPPRPALPLSLPLRRAWMGSACEGVGDRCSPCTHPHGTRLFSKPRPGPKAPITARELQLLLLALGLQGWRPRKCPPGWLPHSLLRQVQTPEATGVGEADSLRREPEPGAGGILQAPAASSPAGKRPQVSGSPTGEVGTRCRGLRKCPSVGCSAQRVSRGPSPGFAQLGAPGSALSEPRQKWPWRAP